jgi:hypothetical protein
MTSIPLQLDRLRCDVLIIIDLLRFMFRFFLPMPEINVRTGQLLADQFKYHWVL